MARALTPLAIAALAVLSERDMHPYEMFTTMIERREDLVVKLRAGSLYHTVARLADDGLVAAVGTERDGNRPERTTYTLLEPGRQRLDETIATMLAEPIDEYPSFPLAVAEAHRFDRGTVIELLMARAEKMEHRGQTLRAGQAVARERATEPYLLDIDYLAAMAEAEAAWLRRLITRLNDDALNWKASRHDERHD